MSTRRSSLLSAQVQSYALALTITFLALLLAAGAIASERDENAIGRLRRGLVSMGELVSAKVALAALVSLALGLTIALVFGVIVEAGGVAGGEPWQRLPLLALGLLLAGAALGGIGTLLGALARETRTASLVAVLVVMPIVFLGLVPREVAPVAGWISDALPVQPRGALLLGSLYDAKPWGEIAARAAVAARARRALRGPGPDRHQAPPGLRAGLGCRRDDLPGNPAAPAAAHERRSATSCARRGSTSTTS